MTSIHQLCDRLGIRHPLEQSTCIGYGQRKPTCGCAVAQASRQSALMLMNDIVLASTTGLTPRLDDLCAVAGLLLCKNWHQYQAQDKAADWSMKLQFWKPRSTRGSTPLFGQTSGSTYNKWTSRADEPLCQDRRHSLRNHSSKAILEEVKRRISSSRYPKFTDTIIDLVNAMMDDVDASDVGDDIINDKAGSSRVVVGVVDPVDTDDEEVRVAPMQLNCIPTHRFIQEHASSIDERPSQRQLMRVSQALTASMSRTSTSSVMPLRHESTSNEPPLAIVRQARISALASAVTLPKVSQIPMERNSVRVASNASKQAPLRQSHEECGACYLPYDEDESEDYWECRKCLNRSHIECFDAWRASVGNGSSPSVTCMYCRVVL